MRRSEPAGHLFGAALSPYRWLLLQRHAACWDLKTRLWEPQGQLVPNAWQTMRDLSQTAGREPLAGSRGLRVQGLWLPPLGPSWQTVGNSVAPGLQTLGHMGPRTQVGVCMCTGRGAAPARLPWAPWTFGKLCSWMSALRLILIPSLNLPAEPLAALDSGHRGWALLELGNEIASVFSRLATQQSRSRSNQSRDMTHLKTLLGANSQLPTRGLGRVPKEAMAGQEGATSGEGNGGVVRTC